MQKVLPPDDLKDRPFSSCGEEVVREDLICFLQDNGYASARVVEERGEYSLRGGIIDVFSPSYEEPAPA